ncbi:Yip1 family protein [Marinibacterium sp. SX1]|uniref:Yip1 family protein n=1 Tax=Marinibacterium sp. SX1 TaxID=3388424 RepID=UPI003D169CD7
MNGQDWGALALVTVKDPAQAARQVMGLGIPREALWLVLAVISALNTILLFGPAVLAGLPVLLPGALAQPVPYFLLVAVGLAVMIWVLHWIGTKMGGSGSFDDVAAVMIWMQALRVAVQLVSVVLQFLFPFFALVLSVVVGVYSLFILLHFIDQALRLGSLARSAGVLIASILALALAMTLLLTLVGGPMGDPIPNV